MSFQVKIPAIWLIDGFLDLTSFKSAVSIIGEMSFLLKSKVKDSYSTGSSLRLISSHLIWYKLPRYTCIFYRWKGENVSTNEVANVLTKLDFIQDANVYGVEIPGKTTFLQSVVITTDYQNLLFWG